MEEFNRAAIAPKPPTWSSAAGGFRKALPPAALAAGQPYTAPRQAGYDLLHSVRSDILVPHPMELHRL